MGLGDLFHQYPNILKDHMTILFNFLKSSSTFIKKTIITVLSHLVLNDYMKIKREIFDFVLLLEDKDAQIVENV